LAKFGTRILPTRLSFIAIAACSVILGTVATTTTAYVCARNARWGERRVLSWECPSGKRRVEVRTSFGVTHVIHLTGVSYLLYAFEAVPSSRPTWTMIGSQSRAADEPDAEEASGWPFACAKWWLMPRPVSPRIQYGWDITHHGDSPAYAAISRVIPFYPCWLGLTLDVLLWATAMTGLTVGARALIVSVVMNTRMRRGRCRVCGYDVAQLTCDRCPECGELCK
jgi:hypothetical protein